MPSIKQTPVNLGASAQLIQNLGPDDLYVQAFSAVTMSSGFLVPAGKAVSVGYSGEGIYAVSAGTSDVRALASGVGVYSTALATTVANNAAQAFAAYRGVNLSGAEFAHDAAHLPGVADTDYMYPTVGDYTSMFARGHRMIRLPFRWERIQPTLNGALNSGELTRLTNAVNAAGAAGLKVLLDVHNYARFIRSTSDGGAEYTLGDANLKSTHLVDLWTKLSTAFKANTNVLAYGLMNEPHDLPSVSGAFTVGSTLFDFEAAGAATGWEVDGRPAPTRSTAQAQTGSASLTTTVAADVSNLRFQVVGTPAESIDPANGKALSFFVYVPTAQNGSAFRGRLYVQNSSYSTVEGPIITVPKGVWTEVTWTVPDATWTGHHAVGVQIDFDDAASGSSRTAFIDTVRQGTKSSGLTGAQAWQNASQDCVTAIRGNSDVTPIFVPGYGYSGAQNWAANHPAPWITDPANKITYEAHYYFDMNNSGQYQDAYTTANAAAVSAGFASLQARAVSQINIFANWCTSNNVKGFVGEIGWHNQADQSSWNAIGAAVYSVLDSAKIGAAYWAAGEWYGTSYNLSAYTGSQLANQASPAAVIEAHPSIPATT